MLGRCAADTSGTLIGLTLSIIHPSTWRTEPSCYLEDLFVDPGHRGGGVASALIDDLLELARERGWGRLYWRMQSGNATVRRLYDRYVEADDFLRYRISI